MWRVGEAIHCSSSDRLVDGHVWLEASSVSLGSLSLSRLSLSLSPVSMVVHTLTVHDDWLSRAVTLH